MSLCWIGSQLGSRRISHRAEARCGCFAACYPKERLAFGTGRLVLWNSIRTVRREVDSPLDRVIPMSHVMAPSLTPAMPRPCVRMRRTKRISSLAMDVASADCPKPGQVTAITIEPSEASSLLLGRARPRWRTEARSPTRSRSRTGLAPRTCRWRHTGTRLRRGVQEAFIQRCEFGRLRRLWYFNTKEDCLEYPLAARRARPVQQIRTEASTACLPGGGTA
jgi:hypothetical protein